MSVLSDTGVFILNTAYFLFSIAIVARFLAQIAKADFYNPLAQTVIKVTNPFLVPLRKIIPGIAGLDMASLVLLFVSHVIYSCLILLIIGANPIEFISGILVLSLIACAGMILTLIFAGMFVVMLSSWLGGGNAMTHFIAQIVEPYLAPFRRLNLQMGMLDLSFMVASMTVYIAKFILLAALISQLAAQMNLSGLERMLVGL